MKLRQQFLVFSGSAVGALALAATAYFADHRVFSRLIGTVNPFPIMIPIVLLGFALSAVLVSHGWFAIYREGSFRGIVLSAGLAVVLGAIAVLIDYRVVYPRTMNVAFPLSLAYYPAIAFLAEIVFHLLPLAVFSLLLTAIFRKVDGRTILWLAILIASLADPVFQVLGAAAEGYAWWAVLVTGFHVLVINLLLLLILKRYDFVAALSFRLFYYVIWHIAWGAIRLRVLF